MSTNPKFGTKAGVSLASSLVVLMGALAGQRVFAQDADQSTSESNSIVIEEVVVQGMRQSLDNAQEIKRAGDTMLDAISASDIGALPDRSVLEALQRVPGISIERFASSEDPDHFGTEGSGAVVRGMTQTRSEFNGRDSFTANSGRGLSFQDVPPELMQTVAVYKNQTADMIEGGIAGTIDLVTRKPFDSGDRQLAFSADVTYGDMVEQTTPTLSGLFSDRWDTDIGEIGFLINATYSELEATSHGIQTDKFELRGLQPVMAESVVIPGFSPNNPYIYDGSFGRGVTDRQPRTNSDGSQLFCADPGPGDLCTNQGVLIPNGSNLTMKDDLRTRRGLAMAFQWENPDETLLFTSQFVRSDAKLAWTENALKNQADYNSATQYYQPYAGADYGFNDEGVFTHGLLTNIASGWRGEDDRTPSNAPPTALLDENSEPVLDDSGNVIMVPAGVEHFGMRYTADTRKQTQKTLVQDWSFNIKWTPSDQFELEGDFQYIDAESSNYDYLMMFGTFMNQGYDTRGDTPHLTIYNPWSLASDAERQTLLSEDEAAPPYWANDYPFFAQPGSYANYAASDHIERSDGNSSAFRLDATYYFDEGAITSVKAGVRHAERHQVVRDTTYNWAAIQPFWQSGGLWLDDDASPAEVETINGQTIPRAQLVDWSDFYRGGTVAFANADPYTIHPSGALVDAYSSWYSIYEDQITNTCDDWRPLDARIDQEVFNEDGTCANQLRSDLNGPFLDNEITDSTEINNAFYVRADFELDTEMRIAGNFGLRVVSIESESVGNTRYPDLRPGRRAPSGFNANTFNPLDRSLYPNPADDLPYDLYDESSEFLGDVNNFLPNAWRDFANAASTQDYAAQRYTKTLPSFNLKVELTPELIARFAASKAIALPDIGEMRNYTNISPSQLQYTYLDPVYTEDYPHPDAPPGEINPVDADGDEITQQRIVDADSVRLANWNAEAKNPFLKPMESNQFDLSLEWYFSNAGSVTAAVFYKDLNNFFIQGAVDRNFTNPSTGETQTVTVTGPRNGGSGEMKGFEINYQQFFDMLPEPFDGLGTQINYSNIQASGVPNVGRDLVDGGDDGNFENIEDGIAAVDSSEIGLEGQSEHTANVILMYQKYDFDARIAYNWRSEYLLTSYDVISRMPVYNDDAGFMDASIFYNLTDNIKIGLQGVNLLNTQTKTFQLVDNTHKLDRSWFVNDRRYSLVVRATF